MNIAKPSYFLKSQMESSVVFSPLRSLAHDPCSAAPSAFGVVLNTFLQNFHSPFIGYLKI